MISKQLLEPVDGCVAVKFYYGVDGSPPNLDTDLDKTKLEKAGRQPFWTCSCAFIYASA